MATIVGYCLDMGQQEKCVTFAHQTLSKQID